MKNIGKQTKTNNYGSNRNGFAESYLAQQNPVISYIQEPPSGLLHFIVVIPAYLEDTILTTLISLKQTIDPEGDVEVIILLNFRESDSIFNKIKSREQYKELESWCSINSGGKIRFFVLLAPDLPNKHAGAGLARKIGMDMALQRFNKIGLPDGIILSLDADSSVDPHYFTAIEEKISNKEEFGGCILNFQHPLAGNEYPSKIYEAIIQYELHLRYYKHILKYTGFPYYQYTIGSCFGVKADFYARQGGMNKRKAGEDFYFLHKMFPHKSFADINNTCVYPSPRPSMRVPFGTGATITNLLEKKQEKYLTYTPESFFELKEFLDFVPWFYTKSIIEIEKKIEVLPDTIRHLLKEYDFLYKLQEIKTNTASEDKFIKRFYQWFDGFKVVKYLNYSHTIFHKKLPVEEAVSQFLISSGYNEKIDGALNMLNFFREVDKNGKYL